MNNFERYNFNNEEGKVENINDLYQDSSTQKDEIAVWSEVLKVDNGITTETQTQNSLYNVIIEENNLPNSEYVPEVTQVSESNEAVFIDETAKASLPAQTQRLLELI